MQDPDNIVVEAFETMILQRLDRAPDRVEISPEQLASSLAYCDSLSESYNKRIDPVGWYHSHPRITVNPSHVGMPPFRLIYNQDLLLWAAGIFVRCQCQPSLT